MITCKVQLGLQVTVVISFRSMEYLTYFLLDAKASKYYFYREYTVCFQSLIFPLS